MELKPGYKQTEVGVIPEDWDCVSIRSAASNAPNAIVGGPFGSDLTSADYVYSGVPVIRGTNMGSKMIVGPFAFVSSSKAAALSANLAQPRDVVFTQRGTLGQVSLVPDKPFDSYLVSQSQMKVSLEGSRYSHEYVYHYFSSASGQKQILDSAIQTGVPHTNLGICKKYFFPAPTLAEQKTISEILGDIDSCVEAIQRLVDKKKQVKRAAMQELLTGKRRLPGFEGEWEDVILGEHAKFFKGKGLPKSDLAPSGKYGCVHYGELFTLYHETIRETRSCTHKVDNLFASVANDVLMPTSDVTPRGLAKASCVRRDGIIIGGDILVIRPHPGAINGTFLSYLIRRDSAQILRLVTGTTVYHIYSGDMKRFAFRMPSIIEQGAIVEFLDDLGAELEALEARLEKVKTIKQGMMQQLLTGKIRLT